jgi:uncharacterized protein (TIGR03663 family)
VGDSAQTVSRVRTAIDSGSFGSVATGLTILAVALAFRIPSLADRPMHADEAVLADKFGGLLETGSYRYNPRDYHGPALAWLTLIPARAMKAHRYVELTETTLRIVPALCGVLLAMMPLLMADGLGRSPAVVAAAVTAISPAMVYYSRYYIPEMLLTTLTCATIVSGYRYARSGKARWAIAAGTSAGLMFAAKETAAIAVGCMLVALAVTVRPKPHKNDSNKLWHCAAALAIAVLIPLAMFGFADSWRAAMGYTQRAFGEPAHGHPWNYYLSLLVWRHDAGGPIWSEGLTVALAALGVSLQLTRKTTARKTAGAGLLQFLSVYACAITLAYSLIPYKTPWCVLGPLHAMILLAGAGAIALLERLRGKSRIAVACVLAVGAAHLGFEAWRASFPLASDPRNPYAYAPTSRDVYAVRDSIEKLARSHPQGNEMLIQVLGAENLWPLPWYLRTYPHVEWWRRLGPGFHPADVILLTPGMEPALIHEIYEVPPPGKRDLYRPLLDRYVELRPQLELRGYVRASLAVAP